MTEATREFIDRLREKQGPRKTVWCQHGKLPSYPIDEHQTCIDIGGDYERQNPGKSWGCPCSCHR